MPTPQARNDPHEGGRSESQQEMNPQPRGVEPSVVDDGYEREFLMRAIKGEITTDDAYAAVKAARAMADDGTLPEPLRRALRVWDNAHLDDARRFERLERTWELPIDVDQPTVEALEARMSSTPDVDVDELGEAYASGVFDRELTDTQLEGLRTGALTLDTLKRDPYAEPPDGEHLFRRVRLTKASDIPKKRVRWLWAGRVALGSLSLVAGPEGVGKSTICYERAARITKGELPGEYQGKPRNMLVCATEDSWEHTIVPRLEAHDADLDRIYRVDSRMADDIYVGLHLVHDLQQLEDAAIEVDAAGLILDPLISRLGADLDSHKDAEVRLALEPLVSVAEKVGMAVIGLIHFNKSGSTDPLQLVMASKAFTAVARSVHSAVRDPEDETNARCLFGTVKNNLGPCHSLPTLGYVINEWQYEVDDDPVPGATGRLVWGDDSEVSIRDALANTVADPESRTATQDAQAWLEDFMSLRKVVLAQEAIAEGKKEGHSERTIKRARAKAKIGSKRCGFPCRAYWSRKGMTPDEVDAWIEEHTEGEDASSSATRSVGHSGASPGESGPTGTTGTTGQLALDESGQSCQSGQFDRTPREVAPQCTGCQTPLTRPADLITNTCAKCRLDDTIAS